MKIRIFLATATAAGALLAAGVMANDSNTLYFEQIGDDNLMSVHQSSGGGSNDIGTSSDPVTQQGNLNAFRFSNSGSGSGKNNDIVKADQFGDRNYVEMSTWNGANNNLLQLFLQEGDDNQARIRINGPDNGLIGSILQEGDDNHLWIEQGGSSSTGNQILAVSMIGNANGLAPDGNGPFRRAGTHLHQSGTGNLIQQAYLEGSNNIGPKGSSNTYRNVQRIRQAGVNNGNLQSVAITRGSQNGDLYNRLWVFQTGNENNFSIEQGVNASSFGNHAELTQTGNNNLGTANQIGNENTFEVTQAGDANTVNSSQTGDGNSIVATISGSNNGSGTLGGDAGSLASPKALASGDIIQAGNGNLASLTITGDSNEFALWQSGNLNQVTGAVSGGNGNNATVLQAGNSNVTAFSQTGGGNIAAISQ